MGGFFVFESLRKRLGLPEKCRVVIQGMGNVGGNAARILHEHGHKIIAISDSTGGFLRMQGFDPVKIEEHKKERGSIAEFPGGEIIENSDLLELECDLLIPAALENQITAENAPRIKAKAVLELANGPTTPEADDILFKKGIGIVPDILANSGGVVVSTFEWEQNLKGEHWSEMDVFARLKELLDRESHNVAQKADALHTDLRRGAFALALERLEAVYN
jgi:glutamate dehydrogenase/leucine dehydrogenase